MELELNMATLTARFDDLVERINGIQGELATIRDIATRTSAEARSIISRVEHINGSVGDTIQRVTHIEETCKVRESDSGSWRDVKNELSALRAERVVEIAKQAGREEERDKIKPWRDRGIWAFAGVMALWALLQSANILKIFKIVP